MNAQTNHAKELTPTAGPIIDYPLQGATPAISADNLSTNGRRWESTAEERWSS